MSLKRKLDNAVCDTGNFIIRHRKKLPYLPSWLEWFRKDGKFGLLWLPIFLIYMFVVGFILQASGWVFWPGALLLFWLQMVDDRTPALTFHKPRRQ